MPSLMYLLHLRRQAQAGQRDLLGDVLVRVEVLRGGRDADRGRRDDALQVRVGRQQTLQHRQRGRRVVVAVDGRDQLHVRVLRAAAASCTRSRRSGSSRWRRRTGSRSRPVLSICLASRSTSDVPICSVLAWLMNRWFGLEPQVMSESNDTILMPACAALVQRRAQRGRVVGGDDDRVGLGLDRRLDRRDLRGGGVRGAAADDDLAAELGQRLLATLVGEHLVGVLGVLRDEVDLQALLDLAAAESRRRYPVATARSRLLAVLVDFFVFVELQRGEDRRP